VLGRPDPRGLTRKHSGSAQDPRKTPEIRKLNVDVNPNGRDRPEIDKTGKRHAENSFPSEAKGWTADWRFISRRDETPNRDRKSPALVNLETRFSSITVADRCVWGKLSRENSLRQAVSFLARREITREMAVYSPGCSLNLAQQPRGDAPMNARAETPSSLNHRDLCPRKVDHVASRGKGGRRRK